MKPSLFHLRPLIGIAILTLFSSNLAAWPRVTSFYQPNQASTACTAASNGVTGGYAPCKKISGQPIYHFSSFSGIDYGSNPDGVPYSSADGDLCATAVYEESTSHRVVSQCTEYVFINRPCLGEEVAGPNGECRNKNRQPPCDGEAGGMVGNPISSLTGYKLQFESDYIGEGYFPLQVKRAYVGTPSVSEWFFSDQRKLLVFEYASQPSVHAYRPDGSILYFTGNVASGWNSDPDVVVRIEALTVSNTITGWRLIGSKNQVEEYDAAGKLLSISNQSGITHNYAYTTSEITVSHSNGKTLSYQIGGEGKIIGFVAPDGNQYGYSYNSEDRLNSVSYPNNGGARTYHYEDINFPSALTGITDENGTRFATWAYDSQGRAISSEHHGSTEKVTLDYTHIDDSVDSRVTATNALGKQTTYHFTTIHGVRKVSQVEGHQSTYCAAANKAYTYDANGFLVSKTDWLGGLTNYTRDAKGQELTRIEAAGSSEERLFTTEWHPTLNVPTKITSSNYELIYSYDSAGNLISSQRNDLNP